DDQLAQARRGAGGLVVLEAESGGGKSRLLDELAQRGRRHGAWVFRGQGADQVAKRPFQVLVGVAAELLAAADPGGGAGAIRDRLADQAVAVCAALPELAGVLGSGAPERLGPEPFGQFRSLQALTALLDALGT